MLLLRFAAGRAACGGRAAAGRAAGARGVRDVRVVAGSNGDAADCKSTDDLLSDPGEDGWGRRGGSESGGPEMGRSADGWPGEGAAGRD